MFKRKTALLSLFTILLSLTFIIPVYGQGLQEADTKLEEVAGGSGYSTPKDPALIAGQIVQGILSFLGIIFMLLIIYGGFLWMTASGAEEQLKKAKDIIKNAVIGLAIVLTAYAVTTLVVYQLTGFVGLYG